MSLAIPIMNLLYALAVLAAAHVAGTWIMAIRRGLDAGSRPRPEQLQAPRVWPSVSVIVPAWNERGTLERCIASLQQVDYPAWEVIIVAGGDDDTFQAALEASAGLLHFQVIEQGPHGKNGALNQGLRVANGQVIVLLDADSVVSPQWLRALVAPLDGSIGATTGNPLPLRQTATSLAEQMERIGAWFIHKTVILQGCGGIAVRRQLIDRMGGFPEDVFVGVDWDLDARLAHCGVVRAVCPSGIVHTERPATLGDYWRNEVRWRRAHLASLIRLREHFLYDVLSAAKSLYIYALAWFALLLTGSAAAALWIGTPSVRAGVLSAWALFVVWIALRRAALAVEVAGYTHQREWLGRIWMPPLLLFITLLACCIASLSLGRTNMHFKGPRGMLKIAT